jgi:hypothetical protein
MRQLLALAVAISALAGCGGNGESARVADQPAPSAATPSPTPDPQSLRATCPDIEAALPRSPYPRAGASANFLTRLEELRSAGDTETRNAIDVLIPLVEDLAADPSGSEYLEAHSALLEALDTLADRCKAVGSSALQ